MTPAGRTPPDLAIAKEGGRDAGAEQVSGGAPGTVLKKSKGSEAAMGSRNSERSSSAAVNSWRTANEKRGREIEDKRAAKKTVVQKADAVGVPLTSARRPDKS